MKNALTQVRMYRVVKCSGLFSREYYLHNNLDVARSCMDPLRHYIRHGWREGRNPGPLFDTNWYLKQNPDVARAGINPLYHYICYGLRNGRNRLFGGTTFKGSANKTETRADKTKPLKSVMNTHGQVPIERKHQYAPGCISVIIPAFNAGNFLSKLLDSIHQQTYNYIEVIVVDDGSSEKDNTKSVVEKYKCKLDLSFHKLEKNHGANFARNYGYAKSHGEYLFFCDSDVILSDDIMEKMLQRMHDVPLATWVYCNYLLGDRRLRFCPFQGDRLYVSNYCSTMSLIRRVFFCGFDETIERYQDWDLFLTIYEANGTGEWIDEFLFYAEDRPDGITNTNLVKDLEARAILQKKHKRVVII